MMSQQNYSVQRTFISFDVVSDEIPRKRSSTWDGAISCGSCTDREEADNCSTSSGSAGDAPMSDGTVDESTVAVDLEDHQEMVQETSVTFMRTHFEGTELPQGCTWLANPQSNHTIYCILPPITVRASDMQRPQQQLTQAPFHLGEFPLDVTTTETHFNSTAPQLSVVREKQSGVRTGGHSRLGSWADVVDDDGSEHSSLFEGTSCVASGRSNDGGADERTTIMLRNLPNDYTRAMLLELLDSEGFLALYDFVYLPFDFKRWKGLGYAFVNFVTHEDAECARAHFDEFDAWVVKSDKVCKGSWGEPLQGFAAHCERYRNSPVMHESVPESVKPVVFHNGQQIAFPRPTRCIQQPKIREAGTRLGNRANAIPESAQTHGQGWVPSPVAECTASVGSRSCHFSQEVERTTIMLRNLPNDYTREMLVQLLDSQGFWGLYDFVYLPVDFQSWKGLGYAFVNLVTHETAQHACTHFDGFNSWMVKTSKVCKTCWSDPVQGFAENCERYRNSPVMHESVPEYVKPTIFLSGQRIAFPGPTSHIKPPRARLHPTQGSH